MKFTYRNILLALILIHGISIFNKALSQSTDSSQFKLFLVGDAGDDDITGSTLLDLKMNLLKNPNSAVVFLGDNCYKNSWLIPVQFGGFDGSKVAKRRILSQLEILRDYKGFVYFIPGNHDWWNNINFKKGKKRLKQEQVFIEDTLRSFKSIQNKEEGTFLPSDGEPGPVSRSLDGGKTRIIFIDTYRLIIEEDRKKRDTLLLNSFYNKLSAELKEASNHHEKIIVVTHHPIHSKGKHSQKLSSWAKLSKHFEDSNINFPAYKSMATHIDNLLKEHHHPDIYYISGHEHSLEYISVDSIHYIVSGAGSKTDKVNLKSVTTDNEYIQFNQEGYFEIDFYKQKEVVLMHHRKDDTIEMQVNCLSGCR